MRLHISFTYSAGKANELQITRIEWAKCSQHVLSNYNELKLDGTFRRYSMVLSTKFLFALPSDVAVVESMSGCRNSSRQTTYRSLGWEYVCIVRPSTSEDRTIQIIVFTEREGKKCYADLYTSLQGERLKRVGLTASYYSDVLTLFIDSTNQVEYIIWCVMYRRFIFVDILSCYNDTHGGVWIICIPMMVCTFLKSWTT